MTAVTTVDGHLTRARLLRDIREAPTQKDADFRVLIASHDPGLDDDDLVLAMLMWEERHQRQGIRLDGDPRYAHCAREGCTRCRVTSLWERAAGSCLPCYGRGVVDSYTVEDQGRDIDVDVPCPECRGTGDRR